MKTDVSKFTEFRKYYLSEFEWLLFITTHIK